MTPDPQQANIEEILKMIREIGGAGEAFSARDSTTLTHRLESLVGMLGTHTIIIGIVPTPPASRWTRDTASRVLRPSRLI